jgi:hypothetical protein
MMGVVAQVFYYGLARDAGTSFGASFAGEFNLLARLIYALGVFVQVTINHSINLSIPPSIYSCFIPLCGVICNSVRVMHQQLVHCVVHWWIYVGSHDFILK